MKNNGAFRIRVTDYVASSPYNFTTTAEVKKLFADRNKEGIKSQLAFTVIFPGGLIAPIAGFFNSPYKEEEVDQLDKKIQAALTDSKENTEIQPESSKEKSKAR